jgi:hypothetical protein
LRNEESSPLFYVANAGDGKTNALKSSETHHQTWQRIGSFDLPTEALTVKATADKLLSQSIKLSNIHLK